MDFKSDRLLGTCLTNWKLDKSINSRCNWPSIESVHGKRLLLSTQRHYRHSWTSIWRALHCQIMIWLRRYWQRAEHGKGGWCEIESSTAKSINAPSTTLKPAKKALSPLTLHKNAEQECDLLSLIYRNKKVTLFTISTQMLIFSYTFYIILRQSLMRPSRYRAINGGCKFLTSIVIKYFHAGITLFSGIPSLLDAYILHHRSSLLLSHH